MSTMFYHHRGIVLASLLALSFGSCRAREKGASDLRDELNSSIVSPGKLGQALVVGDASLTGNRNISAGFPLVASSQKPLISDVVVSRKQFVVAFDSKAKVPAWTSWQVVENDLGASDRSKDFRSDDILNKYLEVKVSDIGVTPEDYNGSCFDRGHQAPSADRTKNGSENSATFYMSNMAPQTAFLNRRIWKDLEMHSRDLVKNEGYKLQVFAGPILRDGREGIGRNKDIQVPEAFYKVIAIYTSKGFSKPSKYIAVIMPNVTADGLDPLANRAANCDEQKRGGKGSLATNWEAYKVSLEDIETKAGVTFPELENLASL